MSKANGLAGGSQETVSKFSAIGYLFARDLHEKLKVPVGMMVLCQLAKRRPGMDLRETLLADPKLKFMVDSLDENVKYFRRPRPAGAWRFIPLRSEEPAVCRGGNNVPDPMRDQHFATILYNGMIAPVIPYAIKGVIWYQGESICFGTRGLDLYGHVEQTLVKDWRKQWGRDDLPFYVVRQRLAVGAGAERVVRHDCLNVMRRSRWRSGRSRSTWRARCAAARQRERAVDQVAGADRSGRRRSASRHRRWRSRWPWSTRGTPWRRPA